MLDDVVSIPSFILLCHCTYLYVVPSTEIPLMLTLEQSTAVSTRCLRCEHAVQTRKKRKVRLGVFWCEERGEDDVVMVTI